MLCHLTIEPAVLVRRNNPKHRQSPKLGRDRQSREPKRRFILFYEGENTEPQYFNALKRIHTDALIRVEVVPGVGVPMTIAEKVIERAKFENLGRSQGVNDSFEENGQQPGFVGLVFVNNICVYASERWNTFART